MCFFLLSEKIKKVFAGLLAKTLTILLGWEIRIPFVFTSAGY